MYGEPIQKVEGAGQTVRVEARTINVEYARRICFKLEPGLDGVQQVAIGYDKDGRRT